MERYYLAAIQMCHGMGNATVVKLLSQGITAESIWMSHGEVLRGSGLKEELIKSFEDESKAFPDRPFKIQADCEKKEISLCGINDGDYPESLKNIYNPPLLLFYKGYLMPDVPRLAVVGSRKCSPYGRAVASRLSAEAAAAGITIVSGAAYGIDTEAHKGALTTGRTVAVLGCGPDVVYPSSNRRLLQQILEKGVIISEYAPGTKPLPAFFPARNRIISGLCQGTLVVEAAMHSGSLITAGFALEEGRNVYAVPGGIFSDTSRGCNKLIQQGAVLVQDAEDLLREYGLEKAADGPQDGVPANLSREERLILEILPADVPMTVDEIICRLGSKGVSNIMFQLLQLEMKGLAEETDTHAYVRSAKGDNIK